MKRPVVIITGCSSGLGLALAQKLASKNSYRLIITARESSLTKIKDKFAVDENTILYPLDVTNSDQISNMVNTVSNHWGRIDVLVNNAGICYRSVVEHMDRDSEMIQLETNYLGPMNLIRSVLPIMREQKSGRIINISSVSGMVSMPTMASYSASKHALEGASESLWYEAKPYGIQVCLVEPGFIRSDSFKNVILSKKASLSAKIKGPHSEYYASMSPFVERLMQLSQTTPDDIANQIEKLIHKKNPPLRTRVTPDAKLFWILRRILPSSIFHRIMFMLLPGSHFWGIKRRTKTTREIAKFSSAT